MRNMCIYSRAEPKPASGIGRRETRGGNEKRLPGGEAWVGVRRMRSPSGEINQPCQAEEMAVCNWDCCAALKLDKLLPGCVMVDMV